MVGGSNPLTGASIHRHETRDLHLPYTDPEKKREYDRKWVANRRREFFEDKSCVDCDSREGLELDHVDPAEKVTHRVWSWSQDRRDAELAKCVVRCGSCHDKKSAGEHAKGVNNGRSKVNPDQVREIRERVAAGESAASVARSFGIQKSTTNDIVHRRTWSDVA